MMHLLYSNKRQNNRMVPNKKWLVRIERIDYLQKLGANMFLNRIQHILPGKEDV